MNKQKKPLNVYVAVLRKNLKAKGVTKKRIDGLILVARSLRDVATLEEIKALIRRLITMRGIEVE